MSSPRYIDHIPLHNFIGVKLDAPIFFRINDYHGLDLDTLNVSIEGVSAITNGVYQTGFEGTITNEDSVPKTISVIVYKISPFVYSQIVVIESSIQDLNGEIGADSYEFVTLSDPDIQSPLVVATLHGGLFNSSIAVNLVSDNPAAVILYTLDGTTPNLSSDVYLTSIPIIVEGTTTLKFIVHDASYVFSSVVTEIYVVDSVPPVSHATPESGSYFSSQEIILVSNDPQAVIYYTVNGQSPTTSSPVYTTPIKIHDNRSTVIKFFAVDLAGNAEQINTETYIIEIAKNNFVPTNIFVSCPYNQSELFIRWDDMHPIYNQVVGYNIYRGDVEMGPYQKLNSSLIGITQFSDKTLDTQIINEDVSEQFKRTVNISRDVNDNFSSTGVFDKSKWVEVDPAQLLFQYNGLIFKDGVGLKQASKLVSTFKLRGNFEIKVKYDLFKWLQPDAGTQICKFLVKKNDFDWVEVSRSRSHTIDVYCTNQYVNGNPELPLTLPTIEVYGEFKIIRVNDIVSTYFYDRVAGEYVLLGMFDNYTEDLYVEFSFESRDKPIEVKYSNFEVVSGNPVIIEPLNPRKEYVIYLSQHPVVDDTGSNKSTDDPSFVTVTVDGKQAYVRHLQGVEGLIELETDRMYDEVKKTMFVPPVPTEFSTVLVTYRVPLHTTSIRLRKNYFYKVTCVTSEDETDLDLISPEYLKPDKMTYIFEEAVRRNAWLLDQGGERVLLYIKKKAGTKCRCTYRDMKERTHKQPDQDCETCFGSGFVGGFDGPFPVIIGPLMTEQRVQQTDRGLRLAYQIETWLGPTPLVNQRDMIIRRNGDRCLVGPLTPVEGPGGVKMQQHFVVEILDSTDVRYKFRVVLPGQTSQPGIDKSSKHLLNGGPNVATIDSPKEREGLYTSEDRVSHENENVDHIVKGRSIVFENINY